MYVHTYILKLETQVTSINQFESVPNSYKSKRPIDAQHNKMLSQRTFKRTRWEWRDQLMRCCFQSYKDRGWKNSFVNKSYHNVHLCNWPWIHNSPSSSFPSSANRPSPPPPKTSTLLPLPLLHLLPLLPWNLSSPAYRIKEDTSFLVLISSVGTNMIN